APALAAACAPTMPPAPALLSTTTGTFHASPIGCVVKRAVVSTGPPGGNGTMKLTGCSGHLAARARKGKEAAAQAAPSPAIRRRRCGSCIGVSPVFLLARHRRTALRGVRIICAPAPPCRFFFAEPPVQRGRSSALAAHR